MKVKEIRIEREEEQGRGRIQEREQKMGGYSRYSQRRLPDGQECQVRESCCDHDGRATGTKNGIELETDAGIKCRRRIRELVFRLG